MSAPMAKTAPCLLHKITSSIIFCNPYSALWLFVALFITGNMTMGVSWWCPLGPHPAGSLFSSSLQVKTVFLFLKHFFYSVPKKHKTKGHAAEWCVALIAWVHALSPFPESLLSLAFRNGWGLCLWFICMLLCLPASFMPTPWEWELCATHSFRPTTVLDISICSGNRLLFFFPLYEWKTKDLEMPFRARGWEASWSVFAFTWSSVHLEVPRFAVERMGNVAEPQWEPLHRRRIRDTQSPGVPWGRNSGRAGKWAALLTKVLEVGCGSLTMRS